MCESKTTLFEEKLQEQASLFKALSHPVRIQILLHLAKTRTCLSGDISDMFPLSRTTLNQHIKELKEAGLIVGRVEGAKIVYCLDCSKIKNLESILENFLNEIRLPTNFSCKYRDKIIQN